MADLRSYQKHQSRLSHTAVHSGKCHPLTTSLPRHLYTLKLSLNSKHQDISNYTMISCLWEVNALLHAVHILRRYVQERRRINVNHILAPWTTEVYGHIDKDLPVDSILSQINTAHTLTPYFCMCHFNITLQFTTTCSKWFLPFMFSTKTPYELLMSSTHNTHLLHIIICDFINLIII